MYLDRLFVFSGSGFVGGDVGASSAHL